MMMIIVIIMSRFLCPERIPSSLRNRRRGQILGKVKVGSGDFPAYTPAEAGTRFSDPGEMQG